LTFLTLAWDQWRDQSENEDDEKNKEVIMDELTESDDSSLSMVDPRREEEVLPPSPPLRPRSMSTLLEVSKAEG